MLSLHLSNYNTLFLKHVVDLYNTKGYLGGSFNICLNLLSHFLIPLIMREIGKQLTQL